MRESMSAGAAGATAAPPLAMLEDENIGELRRRMEPEQMARDLDRDARERGL
jgi:hypothetical protein